MWLQVPPKIILRMLRKTVVRCTVKGQDDKCRTQLNSLYSTKGSVHLELALECGLMKVRREFGTAHGSRKPDGFGTGVQGVSIGSWTSK